MFLTTQHLFLFFIFFVISKMEYLKKKQEKKTIEGGFLPSQAKGN